MIFFLNFLVCVGCLGRPEFSLNVTTKTPKGHRFARQQTVK